MARTGLGRDFWIFWSGETISNLGSSITQFAIPLLVYKLTGSALFLGIGFAAAIVPNLLFGLLIGALVDRVDRKRLMIATDLLRAVVVISIPLAAGGGLLSVGWLYVAVFLTSTLSIFFDGAEFAAVPSLVGDRDIIEANGRIQASYAAASVIGPLAAGALLVLVPVEWLLLADALSFVVSAVALAFVARSFNRQAPAGEPTSIWADVMEGLRYVLRDPVLRSISLMMAIINVVSVTTYAQIVLFAKERYAASDAEVGLLYASGGVGVVVCSLLAGPLRRRWRFRTVALGALMLDGLLLAGLPLAPTLLFALPLWAFAIGAGNLFNINTGSLRQSLVPDRLLGRVISVARVLAWSAQPVGAVVGGIVVERSGNISLVYAVLGLLVFLVAFAFRIASPLGRA
ncbi:MAG: MFS transporter [Chloroflexi bacterium]|nr:MFS transporter [Chloroflexota bacterium]